MSLPPAKPTPAYTRFKQSMLIDYNAWREGEPYDIDALTEISDAERDLLTDELCEKTSLDWRDVEALRALATPEALKRVGLAAATQADGGGVEAFMDEVEQGWTQETEARFIEKLERAQSMTGALDRLFEIAEAHPTSAVIAQLLRGARISSDPTVRYAMGAFLLELTGHADTRYTFDENIRPHLLDLNSDEYKTYKAAVAWLEEKVANPKR
ncbi:MAG TPA: hypothetical protein VG943_10850 [Caulobacterales bacterium]|nr:hypothetical protein [Caulobacterales bacterium]